MALPQIKYRHDNATTVKVLLDAGADVNLTGSNLRGSWKRDSFFDWVYRRKRREVLEVLELLIAAGARIIGVEGMMKELNDEIELKDRVKLNDKLP